MFQTLRSREAAMPFIMIAVLIDMAAIGVIVPVLPTLVASFATDPADQAFWYGVVAAAFGLANFVASPILGALSDHFGRRPCKSSWVFSPCLGGWRSHYFAQKLLFSRLLRVDRMAK